MDYISFFSLRGWGKFKNGTLTTEQVYIVRHSLRLLILDSSIETEIHCLLLQHAKCMIVDDRLVIIGELARSRLRSAIGR